MCLGTSNIFKLNYEIHEYQLHFTVLYNWNMYCHSILFLNDGAQAYNMLRPVTYSRMQSSLWRFLIQSKCYQNEWVFGLWFTLPHSILNTSVKRLSEFSDLKSSQGSNSKNSYNIYTVDWVLKKKSMIFILFNASVSRENSWENLGWRSSFEVKWGVCVVQIKIFHSFWKWYIYFRLNIVILFISWNIDIGQLVFQILVIEIKCEKIFSLKLKYTESNINTLNWK